jgi:TrmH family RNA methyltransferase
MITSPSNPRIKMLRKLQTRKYRDETGWYYLEGPRHVLEAISLKAPIEYLVVCPELINGSEDILTRINTNLRKDQILEVNPETFKGFSTKDGPKGLAAVLHQQWASINEMNQAGLCWVALSSVANPGNLGTILRTCDAVGVQWLILLDRSTDPYDPTALRAAMGAHFSVRLVKAGFDEMLAWKRARKLEMIGTSDRADQDYHQTRYPRNCILLMGSEREGLTAEMMAQCDQLVSIPMAGRADSLNLSVATSVLLYEMYNQKRDKP